MLKTDVVIIGAGPSGSASASILVQKGYSVTIVEKAKFPRFVIGESLLPRCMELLEEADLLDAVTPLGFQKKFGAMFTKNNSHCDFNFSEQYTKGAQWTWQVPRGEFDKALADKTEQHGAKVIYETAVTDVTFTPEKVITSVSSDEGNYSIESKFIIDSSGYGRVLPNLLNLNTPSTLSDRSSIFTHVDDLERPDTNDSKRIQVIVLENNVWFWIIPFSNGVTSIGFTGNLSLEDGDKNNQEEFIRLMNSNETIKTRFKSIKILFEPKKIRTYSISVTKFYGDRFVLTGNSTEFLDPIFSSGVTFALESGVLAAKLVAKELDGEAVNWDKEYVDYIQKGVDVFRSYIDAWYDGSLQTIFFAKDINQSIKEQICSVLAGYVWDETNPFAQKHYKAIKSLEKLISFRNSKIENNSLN